MPFSDGPMLCMTLVNCRPTMPPPKILGCSPTSSAARSIPTESGGYEATNTMSALVALMARTIGV
jgi:hypothetical protein